MNYIKEINAFYDRQEQVPLSGAAVALWYALMHINNKTRWKNTFTSPGSVLCNKAGLSESSFKRARKELEELGYIEVKSQKGGRAPIYTMHSLIVEPEFTVQEEQNVVEFPTTKEYSSTIDTTEAVTQGMNQCLDQVVTQAMDQGMNQHVNQGPDPLYKQYINKTNTKQNDTKTAAADAHVFALSKELPKDSSTLAFYKENFGQVSPFVAQAIENWTDLLGEALVIEAMKRALERNKPSWGYVKSILTAWKKKGILTVEQAETERLAFEQAQQKYKAFWQKEEVVPKWYEEVRSKRRQVEQEREKGVVTEKEMKRIEERLRELREA